MSKTNLQQAGYLFGFLKELLRLRNKPVKTITTYSNAKGHWVHHLDETPATKNGIAFWGSVGLRALNSLSGDIHSTITLGITTFKETKDSILRLPKITTPEPPHPSHELGPWIAGDLDFIYEKPSLLDEIEIESEDGSVVTSSKLKDFPGIVREFQKWMIDWEVWAEKSKDDLEVQRMYSSLFNAREQIRDQSQDWEFVLGIGRLRLGIGTEKEIDRHIFVSPCVIDLDAATGTLFVRVDTESSFRIEDEWIQGFKKPVLADLEIVRDLLNNTSDLTDESIKTELIKLAHKFRADIVTDIDPADFKKRDSLVLAPSLILRKRGKQDLIALLEKLELAFNQSDRLPPPLQSLLEPGFGEQSSSTDWSGDGAVVAHEDTAYLPLRLNSKQLKALESADMRNATIIQGPPGTGKTRTIAVMISHFLAKGQRVLVAAQTPQALREVRSQLPDEIKDLAVASLGSTKSDNDDRQKAVNALMDAYGRRSELSDDFEKFEKEIRERIEALHSERAATIRSIIDLRGAETEVLEIEGQSGSRAHLSWVHLEQRAEYSWLAEISDENSKAPMFSAIDADLLGQDLRKIWQSPLKVTSNTKLPKVENLWNEERIIWADKLRSLRDKGTPNLDLIPAYAEELAGLIEPALTIREHLLGSKSHWCAEAIAAGTSFSDDPLLIRIENALKTLESLNDLVASMGQVSEFECSVTSLDWLPLLEGVTVRVTKRGPLKTSVTGSVKKPLIAGSLMKNAEPILNKVKIRGKSPSTQQDIDRVKAIVQFDHLIITYLLDMNLNSEIVPTSRYEQVIWLNEQKRLLEKSLEFAAKVSEVKAYMKKKLPKSSPYLHDDLDLDTLYSGSLAINADSELKNYERELNLHLSQLRNAVAGLNLKYVDDYISSLEQGDISYFNKFRAVLQDYIEQLEISHRALNRIREIAGNDLKFIQTVISWIDEERDLSEENTILNQVRNLVDAFKWKRLGEALGGVSGDEYGVLFRNITRCDDLIEENVRELARRRSWKKALDRIDPKTLSQMQRYATESRKYGAGTGITAARRMTEIRKLLNDCLPAIPAWIMPIDQVAQEFPAKLELFDVIIVDEASQARLDSIFLLALSKRIVIVGDHKQVSPDGGMLADAEVQQIVNRYLADDPRKANWGNTDLSLFDECKAAFGSLVTLTEHRRCVPEIIGFSNQIAYIPENIRLIPVRQTGSEALPPVKTIFVPDGYVRKSSGQPENPPEADVIANEVARMVKDPAYRGMTIGVITLQGSRQWELIRERLRKTVDAVEMEARQIRVGMPPDFQGSERNVILLSMVMAPNEKFASQTRENMIQRYNVAASRAKDQLVLVHSLRTTDLKNTNDLRRQLLDYCLNVEAGLRNPVEGAVGIVPENEIVKPFDSLFEQRVHNRIVERGYKVIPQFRPEIDGGPDYRIDLVVVGPYGKFAIECDGDFWHGGPEAFANDLIRQEILQRCGWIFFRIPESRFYSDPRCMDELWPMLERFVSVQSTAIDPKPTPAQVIEETEIDLDGDSLDEIDQESSHSNDSSFDPDPFEFSPAGQSSPKEIYVDGLRVREFPKPISPEFSWLQPYRSWDREDLASLTKIAMPSTKIFDEILEIVKIEGPILGSYLMRRHYKATGGASLSSVSEAEYVKQIKKIMNRGELVAEEQVSGESLPSATFRLPNQQPVITRVRGARDLYEMPPREIAMIIRGVLKTKLELSKSADRELLYRQVLLLLDFTKLTPKARDHLNRIFATYATEIIAR
jgi:hypothetical protein